jgi:hypothetical protein
MPGFDGTGPRGLGPLTGGGRGFCIMPLGRSYPYMDYRPYPMFGLARGWTYPYRGWGYPYMGYRTYGWPGLARGWWQYGAGAYAMPYPPPGAYASLLQ